MFCSIHYAESKYVFFIFKTEGKSLKKLNLFKKKLFLKILYKNLENFLKILVRRNFSERNFCERKFSEKNFSEKNFSEKNFSKKKFSDKNFSKKNFSEKNFSEKIFTKKNFSEKILARKNLSEKKICFSLLQKW